MSIELNRNLLYWYFQENQCLNIKKHAVHNIHRLTWGLRVTPQHAHALRQYCFQYQNLQRLSKRPISLISILKLKMSSTIEYKNVLICGGINLTGIL
jgi:hypothetical protein